jgi:ATP/maltotriose-dependent transcriptional regulator MalT
LTELLNRSLSRSSATIISGRAGTGKTTLAAEFASMSERSGWCSLDSSDADWYIFSAHFAAAVTKASNIESGYIKTESSEAAIEDFLISICSGPDVVDLIVLDDIHHLFDAPWFNVFFSLLIGSIPFRPHLLMTSRSRPPAPLWRMRSKQALEVIDEKLLDFNRIETEQLFELYGIESSLVDIAYLNSFGRVSHLLQVTQQQEIIASTA